MQEVVQNVGEDVVDASVRASETRMVALITSVKDDLDSLIVCFDDQAARLDRQGGLLRAGTRRIAGLDDWAERIDQALEQKDRQILELQQRLNKLEHPSR